MNYPATSAASSEIVFPTDRAFPESITSLPNGTLIIGSAGTGAIFKVAPGTNIAETWIKPRTGGLQLVFGVYADSRRGNLLVCSGSFDALSSNQAASPSALFVFDLASGAYKGRYTLPTPRAICNDVAVDGNGNTYVTDFINDQVLVLKRGGKKLDIWAEHDDGSGKRVMLDGIVVLGERVIMNGFASGKLYSIAIGADGMAGKIADVILDRTLSGPDGMRSVDDNYILIAERGETSVLPLQFNGKISRINLEGNRGRVTTLCDGLALGGVGVTRVGNSIYALFGQLSPLFDPKRYAGYPGPLYGVVEIREKE